MQIHTNAGTWHILNIWYAIKKESNDQNDIETTVCKSFAYMQYECNFDKQTKEIRLNNEHAHAHAQRSCVIKCAQ